MGMRPDARFICDGAWDCEEDCPQHGRRVMRPFSWWKAIACFLFGCLVAVILFGWLL